MIYIYIYIYFFLIKISFYYIEKNKSLNQSEFENWMNLEKSEKSRL